MNELKSKLSKIIEDNFFVPVNDNSIILKENHKDATLKKVVLNVLGAEVIVLKPDKTKKKAELIYCFLKKGFNKRCDYLIFAKYKNRKYLFFIELKSKNYTNSVVLKKFKGTECLLDYCSSIFYRFINNNNSNFLKHLDKRFVLFYHERRSSVKRQTKIRSHNTPDTRLKYPIMNPSKKNIIHLNNII